MAGAGWWWYARELCEWVRASSVARMGGGGKKGRRLLCGWDDTADGIGRYKLSERECSVFVYVHVFVFASLCLILIQNEKLSSLY